MMQVPERDDSLAGQDSAPDAPLPLSVLQIERAPGRLSNGREVLVVGARGAAILSVLLARVDEAVPKPLLIDAGWPGYIVEEGSLSVQIASLRRALERLLGGTRWIETVPHLGYRLLSSPLTENRALPARWEPPTIAVLPLSLAAPPSGTDEAEAVALADTITAVLALHGGLSVAPRSAARLYADSRIGTAGIAADLGVRYLLEGSWLHRGTRLRVSLQLADAVQGRVIWSERFDLAADDAFAAQDAIAARLVEEVDVLLVRGEEARIGYGAGRNLTAWTHYIRGLGHAYWPRRDLRWGHEMALALTEWQAALALDARSPDLMAALGAGHAVLAAYGDTPPAGAPEQALRHLQGALALAPDHPVALAFLSLMRTEQDRFDQAVALARRAIRLAPHAPAVCVVSAVALTAAGAGDEAVAAMDRAIAASPFFPSILGVPLARAYRLGGKLSEAIRVLEELDRDQPKFDCRELVLAYMQAGRHRDAVNAATRLLLREPGFTVTGWLATQHRADAGDIGRDADALRAVGLPD